jgi:hypothetical protein
MLLGNGTSQLEICVTEIEPPTPQSRGGDVRVVVRVRFGDFAGATDAWILRETWDAFAADLRALEQRRHGEAVLLSISPGELRLRFFGRDRAGHMAVDGEVGTRAHGREALLRFDPIEFDPSQLPALASELAAAVRSLSAAVDR